MTALELRAAEARGAPPVWRLALTDWPGTALTPGMRLNREVVWTGG